LEHAVVVTDDRSGGIRRWRAGRAVDYDETMREVSLRTVLAGAVLAAAALSGAAQEEDFARGAGLVLERRCLECHNDTDKKGGLSLATPQAALAGGDSGPCIEPGRPDASFLLDYISGQPPEMPKGKPPLPADEVAKIRRWIAGGAKWPDGLVLRDKALPDADWWSFRPLGRPPLPHLTANDQRRVRTPIDAFVLARLREHRLDLSPEADKRTLIRRLAFDLIGLPPTPEEIEAFLADDDPRAYEKLVERLLASPHYGERWARHWLDVVHFGETHGYDKDKPREHAWTYRDYVIRALNEDRPYSRFVQEQIAGDVLYPATRDGIEALGFLAAGPWDLIGHAEVPETKIDGKIARHLDRDDMVTNTIQTFCSLTVQCAQCHNHKFDPISQEDYYALQAVFAAIDRTDKAYDVDPAVARKRAELTQRQSSLAARKEALEAKIASRGGPRLADLDRRIAAARAARQPKTKPVEFGWHSGIEPRQDAKKWVQVDLGKSSPLAAVVLYPCHDEFADIGDGFGFPLRYKVEISDDAAFASGVTVLLDRTAEDAPNPGLAAQKIDAGGKPARYVRVTATKLARRLPTDFIFALAELEALDAAGKNAAAGATVTSLDTIEAPPRWRRSNLVDGLYPGRPAADGDLASLEKERKELLAAATTEDERRELAEIERGLAAVPTELAELPPQSLCYVGAVHFGSGTFVGTGPSGGKPRPIFLLERGNVTRPGPEVGPGALSAITALPARFELPPEHAEGQRRAALARWITDPKNPLTWRSIVNRVWHYHFGRGIVDTPNDFGRGGQLPSHPELLDWLAAEFQEGNQSLKDLHRLIVLSATYRQSSQVPSPPSRVQSPDAGLGTGDLGLSNAQALDADNRLLWRANRRRLEAEAIRDSVLFVAGKLDRRMYGPSFRDFVIDKPEHSPHYEYHLHDPDDPRSHRRSIYRFIVRSQQQPFMTTLDCADPSMQVDKRNESLSAIQALALLNNGFMLTMARHYAARLDARGGDLDAKVDRAVYECLGRPATALERTELAAYARQHGLANLCRVLFNLNEFVFVE
jgi:mono/diheme cytochrome c family protein